METVPSAVGVSVNSTSALNTCGSTWQVTIAVPGKLVSVAQDAPEPPGAASVKPPVKLMVSVTSPVGIEPNVVTAMLDGRETYIARGAVTNNPSGGGGRPASGCGGPLSADARVSTAAPSVGGGPEQAASATAPANTAKSCNVPPTRPFMG